MRRKMAANYNKKCFQEILIMSLQLKTRNFDHFKGKRGVLRLLHYFVITETDK